MRRSLLTVPLVLAALASGCTGGATSASEFEGEEKKVADQIEKLESAGKAGDRTRCREGLGPLATELRRAMAEIATQDQ